MGSHRDTSQQSSRGPGLGSPKGHIPSTVHRLKLVTIQLILWRSCHSACESIADRVSCCMGPLPHAVSRLPACVQAARPRPETIGNDIPRASAVQLHRILSVRIMPGGKIKWRFNLVVWVMCEAIICREGAMMRKGGGGRSTCMSWGEPSQYSPWTPDKLRRRILPNGVSVNQLAVHYQWLNCLNTVAYNRKIRINSNSPRAFPCSHPSESGAAAEAAPAPVPASA